MILPRFHGRSITWERISSTPYLNVTVTFKLCWRDHADRSMNSLSLIVDNRLSNSRLSRVTLEHRRPWSVAVRLQGQGPRKSDFSSVIERIPVDALFGAREGRTFGTLDHKTVSRVLFSRKGWKDAHLLRCTVWHFG